MPGLGFLVAVLAPILAASLPLPAVAQSGDGRALAVPRSTGGAPGTSCTCYVDGFQTDCPLIDTTGYPQADCGYLGDPGGGGGGGAPSPDELPPDLTPLGRFFFFEPLTIAPGEAYRAQIVMVNQGGLNTSDPALQELVIDQGLSKLIPGVAVRAFLQPAQAGAASVIELGMYTIDFPLVPRTELGAPTPVLLTLEGLLPASTAPGTYRLAATVDAGGIVPEPNEQDNTKQADPDETITVGAGSPDLVSVGGSGTISTPGALGPQPVIGQPYRVDSSIRNDGPGPVSGSFTLSYVAVPAAGDELARGIALGQQTVTLKSLAPGASRAVVLSSVQGLPAMVPGQPHQLRATLRGATGILEQRALIGTFTPVLTGPSGCTALTLDATVDGLKKKAKHVSRPFQFDVQVNPACAAFALKRTWTFGDGTTSTSASPSHTYPSPGSRTVSVKVECPGCPTPVAAKTASVGATAFELTIIRPSGNPGAVGTPGNNEITLSGVDGKAALRVEAKVVPAAATSVAEPLLRWTVDRGSVLNSGPGRVSNSWKVADGLGLGTGLKNALSIAGYPASNDGFGRWKVRLILAQGADTVVKEQPIEIFFKKDDVATGRTEPNWFHYWLEAYRAQNGGQPTDVEFVNSTTQYGEVPGMRRWTYPISGAVDKDKILVYATAATFDDGSYCAFMNPVYEGVALFFGTLDHERRHLEQLSICDQQLAGATAGSVASAVYGNGWSFNVTRHNHCTVGFNTVPGALGDDDGDGNSDPAGVLFEGPFLRELCQGDDVTQFDSGFSATHADLYVRRLVSWCTALGAPPPAPPASASGAMRSPLEVDACGRMQPSYAGAIAADWSSPGTQHQGLSADD